MSIKNVTVSDEKKVKDNRKEKVNNARGARIARVTESIRVENEERLAREKEEGTEEADGAKSDREASEALRLKQAGEVRSLELIEGSGGNQLINTIIARLNDVINYINLSGDYDTFVTEDRVINSELKATDTKRYSETGNTTPANPN